MSHFISFEPLIVLVYAPCFCLYAVLLSTRRSYHDPLLTLTRSRMTTLQEEEDKVTQIGAASRYTASWSNPN